MMYQGTIREANWRLLLPIEKKQEKESGDLKKKKWVGSDINQLLK